MGLTMTAKAGLLHVLQKKEIIGGTAILNRQGCSVSEFYQTTIICWKNGKQNMRQKEPEEEWHPLFVEALQKQTYIEYLLDILLTGTKAEEKAELIRGYGKEVMRIGNGFQDLPPATRQTVMNAADMLAPAMTVGEVRKP